MESVPGAGIDRRHFLVRGAGTGAGILGAGILGGAGLIGASGLSSALAGDRRQSDVRWLAFDNIHTGDKVKVVYHENGQYVDGALKELDWIMRDPWDQSVKRMDKRLYDLLFALQKKLGTDHRFTLISGYRSPKTNAILRARGRGVAKRSYHMRGWAADVRLKDRTPRQIARAAKMLRVGGVGTYSRSNFAHVDIGPVRSWGG